jgi:hypothetical protein
MYQRRRALALCAGAVLAWGLSACADPATVNGAAGSGAAATSSRGTDSDADQSGAADSTAPASSTAAATSTAPTEYGLPTTAAPGTDPTDVATDPPVTRAPDADAPVVITYVVWETGDRAVEEGSFVQGVVESGGTCTLTLAKGDVVVRQSAPAEPDATTTSCGGISVPRSRLSAGTWSAVVSYESATTQGSSDATEVAVP